MFFHEDGQPVDRYDDSGRNPIGGDIVYHYVTSPTGTDRLPSETTLTIVVVVTSADFATTFHDDHLDGKDGKPGIFQHRGTLTVS
jgi:hypothetical protein